MKKMFWLGALGLVLYPALAWAGVYTGRVSDEVTGEGLPGAEIITVAGPKAKTGTTGEFRIETDNPFVGVSMPGYQGKKITLQPGENNILLTVKGVFEVSSVKVKGKADAKKVVVSKQSLEKAQVKQVTTTLFPDVIKVMQLMPGVTSDNDFSSLMFVRGGGFDEMIAVLDDMVILAPYLWGGRVSVFNPNLVDNVEFHTGGFSAEWPQAMSAILDVHNKVGNPEKHRGFVDLSAATLDIFLEGPSAGPEGSSFLLGLRRTHYDLIIKLFSNDNLVYPYFYDGQVKFNFPLPQGRLTINSIFSIEGMDYLIKKEDGYGSKHSGDTNFHYLDKKLNLGVAYDYPVNDAISVMTLLGCFYNDGSYQLADTFMPFDVTATESVFQLRHVWKMLLGEHNTLKTGLYSFAVSGDSKVKMTLKVPTSENMYYEETIDQEHRLPWETFSGVFVQDDLELVNDFLYLNPSVNAQYFTMNRQATCDPRLGIKAKVTPDWDVYVATGLFSQYPVSAQQLDNDRGNPDLKAEEAIHYIVGTKWDLDEDYFFQLEGFYKDYRNLIISDPDPELNYANHAVGRAYGYDFIFQKKLGGKWDGWITYSYVVSQRKITQRNDPRAYNKPDAAEPVDEWYRSDADRTHAVNIILNYNFTPEWKLALTQKYTTGKPYTPVVGGNYQPAIDEYTAQYGAYNGERMPNYTTTDIKLTLPFFNLPGWSSYVQVSNLFDVKNVDSYQYTFDYSSSRPIYQLPRIFFGGVKYEF